MANRTHSTEEESEKSIQSLRDLSLDDSDPLSRLAGTIDLYKRNRGAQAFDKPSHLVPLLNGLLEQLPEMTFDPSITNESSDRIKELVWTLKRKCYEHIPDDPQSGDRLKQWPRVNDIKLVEAAKTSNEFLGFLDKCFDRSGTFSFISVITDSLLADCFETTTSHHADFFRILAPNPDARSKQEHLPS